MTLALDTNILIGVEKRGKYIIESLENIAKKDPTPACITFINYFEFIQGLKLKSQKNREKSINFIEEFQCLQTTKRTAIILDELKSKYEKMGKIFTLSDLLIASQAIENNLTLVTTDKQFEEIEELKKIIL